MDFAKLIITLERFGTALPAVVEGLDDADARWKPADGAWSIVEVVSHLADEEEFDFRFRLRHVLEGRTGEWPPIDQEEWAVSKRYNENVLSDVVAKFTQQRQESVIWLRQLRSVDFERAYQHPRWGPISAGMLLASWAAHDALHLRQIAKRMYQLASVHGAPFSTAYAGDWKA